MRRALLLSTMIAFAATAAAEEVRPPATDTYHGVAVKDPLRWLEYPAVFMTTGDNDGRVNPLHSRKFTAALQASGSKAPICLRTSAKAGHGQGSSLDETIALDADVGAFVFDQLGLQWPPAE